MNSEEKKRIFICILPSFESEKELIRLQESIGKIHFTGKLTEPENLHLTLKFLGEIDSKTIENVKQSLKEISSNFQEKINARLDSLGTFKYKKFPKIIWIKILSKELIKLQKQIDLSLESQFPKEKRFMSHLTLARIKYIKSVEKFEESLKAIKSKHISFDVTEFYLMESELNPIGPTYNIIETYTLTNNYQKKSSK